MISMSLAARNALHFVLGLAGFGACLFAWTSWLHLSAWILIGSVVLGVLICAAIDAVRHKRELGEMAFIDWLDRCAAIGRQFNIEIDPKSLRWHRRWFGGLSPETAVKQERDLRELRRQKL